MFCRKDRALRLLLSLPNRSNLGPAELIESITTGPSVYLFGTDIPQENISAWIEKGFIKIEFKLPDGLDPKTKGMGASGPNHFWFYHDLPDKGFKQISELVRRNCNLDLSISKHTGARTGHEYKETHKDKCLDDYYREVIAGAPNDDARFQACLAVAD